MSTNKKQCFVIMPFSFTNENRTKEYWDRHFEYFLSPLIEKSGQLYAHRSEALTGDILKQIITNLITSPVVVADLTDYNPNVLWELGVRQSFKHGTITIAEQGTKPPFDIISKSILYYKSSSHINTEFYRDFDKAIANCLSNPCVPDSNILEILSGRGTLYEIINVQLLLRRLDALIEECEWNNYIHENINEFVEKNKGLDFAEKMWNTNKLRSAALELLLTERYLEEDNDFYRIISRAFIATDSINAQMENWYVQYERTERWFETTYKNNKDRFAEEKKLLIQVKEKIKAKFSYILS